MRYCRVGPSVPYYICDIVGWAHPYHILYAILPGGPSIYNMRYCRVGPSVPYYICDIVGWAHRTILYMRYCRVGPSVPYIICDIVGWAHPYHIIYAVSGWAQHIEYAIFRMGPAYRICDIVRWAHPYHITYAILLDGPSIYIMQYCIQYMVLLVWPTACNISYCSPGPPYHIIDVLLLPESIPPALYTIHY